MSPILAVYAGRQTRHNRYTRPQAAAGQQRGTGIDLDGAQRAIERAFAPDIGEGTVEARREGAAVVLDGGNWAVTAGEGGGLALDLPMNDANYWDEVTDAFIENTIGTEAEQEVLMADRELGGALARGLRSAPDDWSARLGERLAGDLL